jgi:hypothetical protein
MESSSALTGLQISIHSIQPPGVRFLKDCSKKRGKLAKDATIIREKIKSNGSGNVHGSSRSSISNFKFGGIKDGWIGLRSMPITCDSGCSSAKSMAQIPVPVPRSRALSISFEMGARYNLPSRTRRYV